MKNKRIFRGIALGGLALPALGLLTGGGCSHGIEGGENVDPLGSVQSALGTFNWLSNSFDNGRTSANTSETILTQANVTATAFNNYFGKLFEIPVDDTVYAQILYASAVPIGGSSVNVIYVATVNNTVYAFNADTGAPVWSSPANLNNGFRAATTGDLSGSGCTDLSQFKNSLTANAGILGTPVIDPASSTLYAVARIKESSGVVYRLYAIDITTGALRKPGQLINPSNSNVTFSAAFENQRPGLAFSQGTVYVGFAGNCDIGPYHGWLVAYNGSTLAQTGAFAVTGNARAGDPGSAGGIWMGGQAPAIDSSGNVYVATGNGTMPPNGEYSESVVKLASRTLSVVDYFNPTNYATFDAEDEELGSAGPTLLPGRNRIVQLDKPGILYLVNPSSLGHTSNALEQFQATVNNDSSCGTDGFHVFSGPAAWVSGTGTDPLNLYVWGQCDYLRAYRYRDSTGQFDQTPFATSQNILPTPPRGGMMTISSNGTTAGSGILWATTGEGTDTLYALNPATLQMLWSSNNSARDAFLFGSRYHPPMVANGKVYVGTYSHSISAFGLRANAHVTGYFDQHGTEAVLYPDVSQGASSLTCGPGGCWVQGTADANGNTAPVFPVTSFSDGSGSGTNGHYFFEEAGGFGTLAGIEEFNGAPPSSANITNVTNGSGYSAIPQSHSSFWDGSVQHIFVAAGNGDGTLHEIYQTPQLFDHAIPKCPYTEFAASPRYVTAYWDGSVQHVIFDCINDQSPYAHELWETYNNGQWFTHAIASTANGGSAPYGQFAGGASGGKQGILGVGVAGTNKLVYTSFSGGVWSSVSISAPSLSHNSTVAVYPDSTGIRYFFVGANGHIYSLASPGSQNTITDLSVHPGQSSFATGTTNGIPWISDLAGFFDGTNDHVFFIGADGFVHEFYGRATDPFTSWFEHSIGTTKAFLP
jgi:outer membrane protein assembly factor BamB